MNARWIWCFFSNFTLRTPLQMRLRQIAKHGLLAQMQRHETHLCTVVPACSHLCGRSGNRGASCGRCRSGGDDRSARPCTRPSPESRRTGSPSSSSTANLRHTQNPVLDLQGNPTEDPPDRAMSSRDLGCGGGGGGGGAHVADR